METVVKVAEEQRCPQVASGLCQMAGMAAKGSLERHC